MRTWLGKFINWLKSLRHGPITTPEGPKPVIGDELLYMTTAFNEIGTHELLGGENPRIVEYHSATSLRATEDEVPWCSAFVCWALEKSGYKSTKSAWAKSFLEYGEKLEAPKYGAIAVLSRGANGGHVGFIDAWDEETITLLGGNQNNQVCFKKYPKERLLGIRWPVKN